MYIEQKNGLEIVNVTVLVFAKDMKRLWRYRDICYDINQNSIFKINVILTAEIQTVLDMFIQVSKGVDLFISDHKIPDKLVKDIEKKMYKLSPTSRSITNANGDFHQTYKIAEHMKCIEHMQIKEDTFIADFTDNVIRILEKIKAIEFPEG